MELSHRVDFSKLSFHVFAVLTVKVMSVCERVRQIYEPINLKTGPQEVYLKFMQHLTCVIHMLDTTPCR